MFIQLIFSSDLFIIYKLPMISKHYLLFRAFDVELLYIAQSLKIPISEVAVNWTEIEGEYFKQNVSYNFTLLELVFYFNLLSSRI